MEHMDVAETMLTVLGLLGDHAAACADANN
jgi:hypothetical protein